MRVAFLTNEYPPLLSGGIGTGVRTLAKALADKGHGVTVIGWGPRKDFDDRGVKVRFLGHTAVPKAGWFLNRLLVRNELERMSRDEGLDIVEAHDWCGVSAGIRLKCPVVVRCHGTDAYFSCLLNEKTRPLLRFAEGMALRQADGIAAVSGFTADVTRRLFKLNGSIAVIHNGVDMNNFRPSESDEEEKGVMLYLGTLTRKKGIFDLCESFAKAVQRCPDVRLWLVGSDGYDKKTGSSSTWELCRRVLPEAALKRAEYFGKQPHDKVLEYLRRASVCVFPSYAEAMPLSWLEAMACAKPVVAYDSGWAREIITHDSDGILVRSGDTEKLAQEMLRLAAGKEKRTAIGHRARKRTESAFSADLMAEKTAGWYEQIIARYRQDAGF